MRQRKFAVFYVIVILGLFQSFFGKAQTMTSPDSILQEAFDTVYIAPDTIKSTRVDTVFEYIEEATTPRVIKKRPVIAMMFGPQAGVGISRMYPMYNKTSVTGMAGFSGTFLYNNWFAQFNVSAASAENASIHYSRHYTNYHHWTDTIKTVLDEYSEIIGKDTVHTQIIKRTILFKTDTLLSDSTFSHKNSYWQMQIPIEFGYVYKTRKTWLGFCVGPSLRLLFSQSSNKVIIGDSSFVNEKSYFKKMTIDFSGELFVKQKMSKHLWTTVNISGTWAFQSNYRNYKRQYFQPSIFLSLGIEYFLKL
jgi:hypothetical protein